MKKDNKNIILTTVFASLLFMVTVILIEVIAAFLLNNSALLPGKLVGVFRKYYLHEDRKLIQYLSDCAIYDNELAYTLKPGKCHFETREFENDYLINSVGVRDDEASLIAPKIIVIGDSHAMGWGVNQDQTFSSLLEKTLRKPVLNASISSYGTVRELKILQRVNLNELEYLIIQYCHNDFPENRRYAENNNILPIMSEEEYNSHSKKHADDVAYYFGKHSLNLISILTKRIISRYSPRNSVNKAENTTAEEVDAFLNAILNSSINLSDVVIIVFEINTIYYRRNGQFIDKLNERMSGQVTDLAEKHIKTIDFSSILGKDKYFRLDEHINSAGHHAIAEALTELIMGMPNNRTHDDPHSATLHVRR